MAKFGKYRPVNKVEQAYYGVDIVKTLKDIKENLKENLKKIKEIKYINPEEKLRIQEDLEDE